MLRTRLPRSRRLFLVGLAAVGLVVALTTVGLSRLRRGDVRWWRGLSDFAPWPDADTADADVREEAARRLFSVVTRALKRSAVTYSVGGPTLFNCHVFRNLTSPMVRGDPHLHLDGLTSRGDVGRLYWCECVARVLPLHHLTSLTVDDVITSSLHRRTIAHWCSRNRSVAWPLFALSIFPTASRAVRPLTIKSTHTRFGLDNHQISHSRSSRQRHQRRASSRRCWVGLGSRARLGPLHGGHRHQGAHSSASVGDGVEEWHRDDWGARQWKRRDQTPRSKPIARALVVRGTPLMRRHHFCRAAKRRHESETGCSIVDTLQVGRRCLHHWREMGSRWTRAPTRMCTPLRRFVHNAAR
jgi:hypothetical protein